MSTFTQYGNLDWKDPAGLGEFFDRLDLIAQDILKGAKDNGYVLFKEGNSRYGLTLIEIRELISSNHLSIDQITLTLNTSDLGNIRVKISLRKIPGREGINYLINSKHSYLNQAIEKCLAGNWDPLTDVIPAFPPEPAPTAVEDPKVITNIFKEKFILEGFPASESLALLEKNISFPFFEATPMNFTLETREGQLIKDVPIIEAIQIFTKRRAAIRTLYIDVGSSKGDWLDIQLIPGKDLLTCAVQVSIQSPKAKEIYENIRLLLQASPNLEKVKIEEVFRKFFSFNPITFEIDSVLTHLKGVAGLNIKSPILRAIFTSRDLQKVEVGSIEAVRQLYKQISSRLLQVALSVYTLKDDSQIGIIFRWEDKGHFIGEVYLDLKDQDKATEIFQYLCRELKLTPITPQKQEAANTSKEAIFRARTFNFYDKNCVFVFPTESYFVNSLVENLTGYLQSMGLENFYRILQPDTAEALEDLWVKLNEAGIIIFDLTHKSQWVYYQLGIAHSLGKKLVIISQYERDIPEVFKINPCITYENTPEGIENLKHALEAWILRSEPV